MLKCIKIQRDTILIATFFIRLFCHPYLRAWGQHLYHSDLISQNWNMLFDNIKWKNAVKFQEENLCSSCYVHVLISFFFFASIMGRATFMFSKYLLESWLCEWKHVHIPWQSQCFLMHWHGLKHNFVFDFELTWRMRRIASRNLWGLPWGIL